MKLKFKKQPFQTDAVNAVDAVEAREKPIRKEPKAPKSDSKHKRGRPRRGEVRAVKEPKRLDLQLGRSLAENNFINALIPFIGVRKIRCPWRAASCHGSGN